MESGDSDQRCVRLAERLSRLMGGGLNQWLRGARESGTLRPAGAAGVGVEPILDREDG
jgi:hypothetical protein